MDEWMELNVLGSLTLLRIWWKIRTLLQAKSRLISRRLSQGIHGSPDVQTFIASGEPLVTEMGSENSIARWCPFPSSFFKRWSLLTGSPILQVTALEMIQSEFHFTLTQSKYWLQAREGGLGELMKPWGKWMVFKKEERDWRTDRLQN